MRDAPNETELLNKLIWLMAIRMLVVLSALLQSLVGIDEGILETIWGVLQGTSNEPVDPTIGIVRTLVATISVQTLVYALLLRPARRHPIAHAYLQLIGDLLLVTLLLYKFSPVTSNLSVLYLAVIGVGTALLYRRAGLILAALATLFFGATNVALRSGPFRALWTETPGSADAAAAEAPSLAQRVFLWLEPSTLGEASGVPWYYVLSVHFAGFLAVAFFSSYLARDRQTLEQKLAERSSDLAELQELYADVVQSISSGLVVTDLNGLTTSVNHAGVMILGRPESELVGTPLTQSLLFDRQTWERLTEDAERATVREELQLERGPGESALLGFTLSLLRDGSGEHRGYILIFQDLTEWRQLQDQVRIQDRMAALGQMAAGLAHEVGNPLAAMSGSVQMLSRYVEGGPQAKLLKITLRESQRLDRTLKAFLQFAKPRDRHPERVDIAQLLAEDVQLLRASDEVLPEHHIELELDPESAVLVADIDQLGQLFWNLARNALQAMPSGGELSISGRLHDDGYQLRFHDTGQGMSEEERAEIFQPFKSFFDGGTGLGMAIVYRIVEEHGGHVEVDSRPGAGTTITIELPSTPPKPETAFESLPTPLRNSVETTQ